ncbi:MAG: cytochrome-c oxidase, cbb3-type subunit III [Paracoccaceae bacterium]|nr:cytochrome-c oxidase, cbb3-type subunit III [Paracoccaceae bacterium]MDE3123577.1 cytochrome-c oxidase, cbb3-type subunit III [Paracoccaceae bacterium]MDE3238492.1 cytochrome-c oxidase, cbb3-type subunit III [Paracoccaceae bacterium]
MTTPHPQSHGKNDPGTTGHSWDGIEELNNPLPKWWLYTFYACILFALVYTILYPAWPLPGGETAGVLHYSTRGAEAAEVKAWDKQLAPLQKKLDATKLTEVKNDPALMQYANSAGAAVFRTNCMQCHGAGAAGNKGYPNLLDDDWLHGGTIDAIYTTILHGVRSPTDPDTRAAPAMPAWGESLKPVEIADVVQYVLKISNQKFDAAQATAGAKVFADNCVACHGDNGKGNQAMGAPNLTDAIWLYGGDQATLTQTITNGRAGVMPSWSGKLSEADIRAVSLYVHGLGGGQ